MHRALAKTFIKEHTMSQSAVNKKQFLAAISLRNLIVKQRFYRKSREERIEALQAFINEQCTSYRQPSFAVNKPHILQALVAFKGVVWANAVYAIASPNLFAKNIVALSERSDNALAAVNLPFVGEVSPQNEDELYAAWESAFINFVRLANVEEINQVAAVVQGNVRLSHIFNNNVGDAVEQIRVYDEDAVLVDPPEEVILSADILQPPASEPEQPADEEDEEAQFNANHQ